MKYFITLLITLCSFCVFSQSKHEDGPFKEYHENGNLKREGFYKDNIRRAAWKEYYTRGNLKRVYLYDTKGNLTGVEKRYYQHGNLLSETNKSKSGGLLKTDYYENGNLQRVYKLVPKEKGRGFLKAGVYKEFYENGNINVESGYSKNELVGVWKKFYPTSELEWEVGYSNGYKHGMYRQFYKNGKVKIIGFHNLNLKDGEEKYFDSIGNETYELKYKKGKLKKVSKSENVVIITVPDGVIEKVPIYPGCEYKLSNLSKKNCMSTKISSFVASRFNTSFARELGLSGKQRINIIFKIDKTGNVIDIRARAKHKALEAEAIRVIALLPKMIPGFQYGKAVIVPYNLPIIFDLKIPNPKK